MLVLLKDRVEVAQSMSRLSDAPDCRRGQFKGRGAEDRDFPEIPVWAY